MRAMAAVLVAGFLLPVGAQSQSTTPAEPQTPTATQTQAPTEPATEPPREPQTQALTEPPGETQTQVQREAQEALDEEKSLESPRPNTGAMVFDVLVARPLGLVVLTVGAAAFIPAALIAAPGGMDSVKEALQLFVTGPVDYVFQRPLGEI
jgi:hypothetical protein